ncbi:Uncharacterised protein [Streptococcus agalactiae]|nr:hypothetical protein SAN_2301 [Streptococcus agalactiae COH1]EAO79026.1 hypothetical protein SAI_2217 [Streptococcus agalactiae H36B]EPT77768.1 hypothetical protein SAG0084_06580 [Streptococcus agalactiae LMG 15085]EPT81135.1 hypothetical protein SAG0091_04510 [Streptococcus agalactiae LMG 15095]EPU71115.1 hypothetical protein SAG0310_05215 [Streptococcus agalactiae GB00097]EPV39962.1 hypothetical protein SAG0347_07145 [Streptococcus agalactiae GB00891]EPW02107.1 hypothetical protein SAG00
MIDLAIKNFLKKHNEGISNINSIISALEPIKGHNSIIESFIILNHKFKKEVKVGK